jgi:DNA-binding CsgD family transcriptional regulator
MDQAFVGRQTELALLRGRLDAARRGTSQTVLIVGAPGVGKTALLDAFLVRAGQGVLRASGDSLETGLAYGVVEQLVGATGEPPTFPRAGDIADVRPARVGAQLLDLLGRAPARGQRIVVVDDAHWADPASLQALTFALRRLRTDRVLVLLAAHHDLVERLPVSLHRLIAGPAGTRLRLGGLETAELQALCLGLGVGSLSRRAAARLREHTDGNPMHARALLEELPTTILQHSGHLLPAPRSFRKLVQARLAACPTDAELLVAAAAVLGASCPLRLVSRVAAIDDPLPALEQAIHARLLEERHTATQRLVAFPDPLVRAAVYHHLGPARRAVLHARAAELATGDEAAVRHRVAAARGPDPELTAELMALAGRQALDRAWTAAADALLTAARLSPTQAEREWLVLQAVDHLLVDGNAMEAAVFADVVTTPNGARRGYGTPRLAMICGRDTDAGRVETPSWWHDDHGTRPDLAAAIAERLALHALLHGDGEQQGPVPAENRCLERSITLGWTDDLPRVRSTLTAALAARRHRRASLRWQLTSLAFLAEVEYRLGAWDDASAHAELAATLVRDTGEGHVSNRLSAFVHAVAALPLAARGARGPAAANISAAATHLERAGMAQPTIWIATAQALLALAGEDSRRIVDAFEPLRHHPAWASAGEPGWESWPALYAEALVLLGRCDQAQAALVPYEARAVACGRRSAQAVASRARGNLEAARGRDEQAETAFRTGLEHARTLPLPFDRALLETAYGRFLRRTGRREEAIVQLKAARDRLATLNARPYLERCDRELAACGRSPVRRSPGRQASLTSQELTVARLVATGRTNRQTADELVVSVKTVEYHLSNIYAKLAVNSRTQLALALHHDQGYT